MQNATVRARDAFRRRRPDRSQTPLSTTGALRTRGATLVRPIVTWFETLTTPARPVIAHGAHRITRRERLATRIGWTASTTQQLRASLIGRERLLPIGVALLVLLGSLSAIAVPAPTGAVGGTTGRGDSPRLAVAGLENGGDAYDPGIGVDGAIDPAGAARLDFASDEAAAQPEGPYLADGTLLKPIAVDTSIADASDTLRSYRVRGGDTLTGIARHFGVSMMTLWWANHLKSKDDLKVGQKLVIPPVDGTVHVVKAGETLAKIADSANVSQADIVSFNGLTSDKLSVGQTLILPGAHGKPIPAPKPAARPTYSSGGGGGSAPAHYGGGQFAWPLPGGTISQYFHYGHPGPRHPGAVRLADHRGRRRHGHLRRLEEQRRRLPGLDRPRLRAVHDLQPHVRDHRRVGCPRGPRSAGRPGRPDRLGHRAAPPLRGLAWRGVGQRLPGEPAHLPLIRADRAPGPVGPDAARSPGLTMRRPD